MNKTKKFKVVAIVQARLNSSRFPGKIMQILENKTVLGHVIENLKKTKLVDEVCCAIPNTNDCNILEGEAKKYGSTIVRGDEYNVLSRFYKAAKFTKADLIVRVTSDCPLTNPKINYQVINNLLKKNADYSVNNMPPSFPHGLDCEVFKFKTLKNCFENAKSEFEKEHVTPWIRNNSKLIKVNLQCNFQGYHNIRLTLDYKEDLIFLKKIFKLVETDKLRNNMDFLVKVINENKSLLSLNNKYMRNY